MADNRLVRVPGILPAVLRANDLRRSVVGRARSVDMLRWQDVPYGPDPAQRMYFWELNDLAPRDGWPVALLIHGGGWREGSPRAFDSLAPLLARRGIMSVAMSYRLAPAHRWPAMLEDVGLALDFLRHQQIDLDRVGLWGHSAGGQLALMAALTWPDKVRCCVGLGAPSDLGRLAREGGDSLIDIFDDDQLRNASPLHMGAGGPPILLVHGESDPVCHIGQARALAAARPQQVQLIEVPGGDHGLRLPLVASMRARRRARAWLVKGLALQKRGSKWRVRKAADR